jgi:DNA-directed RNA polymerase specialized sigma24 family protein
LAQAADSTGHAHHLLSQIERKEIIAFLSQAIECLPERQKLMLWLYYFEELTMKEVGAVLKVNEARISQLHSKAIATLRREMKRLLSGDAYPCDDKARRKLNRRAEPRRPQAERRQEVKNQL